MDIKTPVRRLLLTGSQNTRDLGGYPCRGGFTRWRRFIRSDNILRLSACEAQYLRAAGLDTVIDLRSRGECENEPCALAALPGFSVSQVSLNDSWDAVDFEGDIPGSMAGLYLHLLELSRARIAKVFGIIAKASGGVLFHCAVGKDRTGVIAMLLLELAGVEQQDIIADYAVSDIYLSDIIRQQQAAFGSTIPDYTLYSRPASMRRTLEHLCGKYGGAENYLTGCGLSQAELRAVLDKLVQPARPLAGRV